MQSVQNKNGLLETHFKQIFEKKNDTILEYYQPATKQLKRISVDTSPGSDRVLVKTLGLDLT